MGLRKDRDAASIGLPGTARVSLQSLDLKILHARPDSKALEAHQHVASLDRLTSNAVPSSGALDCHADEPDVGSEVRRKKQSSWDPLARYHSEAHSFPDYGAKLSKMNLTKRMKGIANGSGIWPLNTLGTNNRANEPSRDDFTSRDERPAKRHKKDAGTGLSSKTSPYFENNAVRPRGGRHDSLDDLVEIQSSSSMTTGKSTKRPHQIPEYHNAQPMTYGKKARPRMRKIYDLSRTLRNNETYPATPDLRHVRTKNNPSGTLVADSPDVLAIDDGPPPSNITSDLQRPPQFLKKDTMSHFSTDRGPNIKKPKASRPRETIDDSEDELQANEETGRRVTNFSNIYPLKRQHGRGDIQSTHFTGQRRRRDTKPAHKPIRLVRAVSHRDLYSSGDVEYPEVFLHAEGPNLTGLVPRDKHGALCELPWLTFDLSKVQGYRHDATHSPYVEIKGPQCLKRPPKVLLEVGSAEDAVELVGLIPNLAKDQHVEGNLLKAEMEHMSKAVTHYLERLNAETRSDGKQPQEASAPAQIAPVPHTEETAVDSSRALDAGDIAVAPAPTQKFAVRETRRTRRVSPIYDFRDETPPRWTANNSDWGAEWSKSLVFPATGKNRATVDKDDIPRLDEGQFLNDNLINFYIRYLQIQLEKTHPEILKKVYFFNTFFFEKLRSTRGKINYEGVQAWTAKVDLFSYDYIVVPVNESAHWYLAIICNAPNTLRNEQDCTCSPTLSRGDSQASTAKDRPVLTIEDSMDSVIETTPGKHDLKNAGLVDAASSTPSRSSPKTTQATPMGSARSKSVNRGHSKNERGQPKIITLDSLGSAHSPTCTALREYLIQEAKAKRGAELEVLPVGMTARGIPEQDNYCDCGVFILGYMEEFLKNPDEVVQKLFLKEELGWDIRASDRRNQLRDLVFGLQKEQQKRLAEEAEEKRMRKKAAKMGRPQDSPKSGNSPAVATTPTESSAAPKDKAASKSASDNDVKFVERIEDTPTQESDLVVHPSSSTLVDRSPSQTESKRRLEVRIPHNTSSNNDQVTFVEPLPDSPPIGSPANKRKTTGAVAQSKYFSPKRTNNQERRQYSSPRRVKSTQPVPSIEKDDSQQAKRGARYDGIERTIDITGEI